MFLLVYLWFYYFTLSSAQIDDLKLQVANCEMKIKEMEDEMTSQKTHIADLEKEQMVNATHSMIIILYLSLSVKLNRKSDVRSWLMRKEGNMAHHLMHYAVFNGLQHFDKELKQSKELIVKQEEELEHLRLLKQHLNLP